MLLLMRCFFEIPVWRFNRFKGLDGLPGKDKYGSIPDIDEQ
jgi:hypothetical protein